MKKLIFVFFAMLIFMSAHGQRFSGNIYDVALYQANDSTTFFLSGTKGVKTIFVDFTNFSANDAVLTVGAAMSDKQSQNNISWSDGSATPVASLILNATTLKKSVRVQNGGRYKWARAALYFPNGLPTDNTAITIVWNAVATGTVKFGY